MATRSARPAQPQPANLTTEQMREAIPKLQRRIKDLEAFDPQSIQKRGDPQIDVLEKKLEDTISNIFGTDTSEYARFQPGSLDRASIYMGGETPHHEVIAGYAEGKEIELANLRTIIEVFEEKLEDGGETPATRARRAFGDLDLHPDIAAECTKLFQNAHYSQAVETACKVLELLLQRRSLRGDLSGTNLVRTVFSAKTPVLKFNEQSTDSERSTQEGMMHLFEGAVMALRNPRAHGLGEDQPEHAIECLSFISMLAKSLDRAQRA